MRGRVGRCGAGYDYDLGSCSFVRPGGSADDDVGRSDCY